MNIQLAEPINIYFEISHSIDPEQVKNCFTQDAVVFDEGGSYEGLEAIMTWLQETQNKYEFCVKPISTSTSESHEIVVAEVSGKFPGSPIHLNYSFLLNDGKIQSLKIY